MWTLFWIQGGKITQSGSGSSHISTVEEFDPDKSSWTSLPSMQLKRFLICKVYDAAFRSWLMKTFLANAFAVVGLHTVQEFHLCRLNTNTPVYPY